MCAFMHMYLCVILGISICSCKDIGPYCLCFCLQVTTDKDTFLVSQNCSTVLPFSACCALSAVAGHLHVQPRSSC